MVPVKTVDGDQTGQHDRDGQDQHNELRHRQQDDLHENPDALPLIEDHADRRERFSQDRHQRQRQGGQKRRSEKLPEQVAVDQAHGRGVGLFWQ